LVQFKEERGFHNLIIKPENLREILAANDPKLWSLICDAAFLKPQDFGQAVRLQATIASVLKNMQRTSIASARCDGWERMDYKPIAKSDDNFHDYVVKVSRSEKVLLQTIHDAIEEWTKHYKLLSQEFTERSFRPALYQPLLIAKGSKKYGRFLLR